MRISYLSKILFVSIVCLCPFFSKAQYYRRHILWRPAKIDTIYNIQKKIYRKSNIEPLTGKKYGIELNLFRILQIDKAIALSGTFSLFNLNKRVEIAFPVYYAKPEDKYDLSVFTIDCHYRYFFGNTLNGFYASGFVRYANLNGYTGNNGLFDARNSIGTSTSENKIGIGFGVGFRKFSYRGLYWGASISIGRYYIGENGIFYGNFLSWDDDAKYILDIECLKIGWAF
jgi:hypothetical protein